MHLKILIFILSFSQTLSLSASLSQESLRPYRNEYFVETGAHYGAGLLVALQSGFRYLRSVEVDPQYFQAAQELLKRYRNVKLWYGSSSTLLWEMIQDIEKPITFFLDAHRFPPLDDGRKNCPLLEELEQIKRHPIKTHTILIDDISCCGQLSFDYLTKEDLIVKLLEINPNYQIFYIAGGWENEVPDNILVATPPNHRRRYTQRDSKFGNLAKSAAKISIRPKAGARGAPYL